LLFADVEGSTRLLNLLGERFGPARARMRELVREAAREHDGAEVDWSGDGVFLAFSRARDGVAAAAQIHRSLASEPWPDDEPHRLRIGLHTGEPELEEEGYVGIDVVIAARICAASHGEQTVVSQATRDVTGEAPVEGGSFRPLGRHRLKDVPGATQLFQLVAPGLREDFPPLKTLTATNLPALHHRLVGRDSALARVDQLLGDGARLVTITGPGGAGKSRLALEAAAGAAVERPVHLVGLAPITDPELVPSAIARALGVREEGGETLLDTIGDRLNGTGSLLYLDNLEHLAPASAHVARLLDIAPDLQILATSRMPLHLSTERVLPLEPLALEDATTLFLELAAARGVVLQADALSSVHEICRRLDGLPLAIELVAARLVVLPPAEIVHALGEGLALRMEGPVDLPERQRTLRAAIDWSYHRLTDAQRGLHGCLAVFSDSASLADARALAESDRGDFLSDLEALVGWSLVRSEVSDGEVRLSMLETVREHALERLDGQGELDALRTRHAEHFAALAHEAEPALSGPDQTRWLARLELEYANLAAALDWLLASGRVEEELRVVSSLERFWRAHAHVSEARRWLTLGLDLAGDAPAGVRADALWTAARQAAGQSDWDAAVPLLEEALSLFRGEQRRREEIFALTELGYIALRRDDSERAELHCNEALALARELHDDRAISAVLTILSDIARTRGEHERALNYAEEALERRGALGDPMTIVDSTYHVGMAAFAAGDLDRSAEAFEATLEHARSLSDSLYTAAALCMLGTTGLLKEDLALVENRLNESLAIYVDLHDDRSRAECLCALGAYAAATGHPEEAARLWGAGDAARGTRPLEYAEPALEARFTPSLVELLGTERLAELRAEGQRSGYERVLADLRDVVASTGAE
jgi:predicted ATPase/class 3 adenylate cyclase